MKIKLIKWNFFSAAKNCDRISSSSFRKKKKDSIHENEHGLKIQGEDMRCFSKKLWVGVHDIVKNYKCTCTHEYLGGGMKCFFL